MSFPKFDPKISVGAIIQIATLLVTGGIVWGQVNARIDSMDVNGTQAVKSLRADIQKLTTAIVRLETKLEERERYDANKR